MHKQILEGMENDGGDLRERFGARSLLQHWRTRIKFHLWCEMTPQYMEWSWQKYVIQLLKRHAQVHRSLKNAGYNSCWKDLRLIDTELYVRNRKEIRAYGLRMKKSGFRQLDSTFQGPHSTAITAPPIENSKSAFPFQHSFRAT